MYFCKQENDSGEMGMPKEKKQKKKLREVLTKIDHKKKQKCEEEENSNIKEFFISFPLFTFFFLLFGTFEIFQI